MGTIKTPTDNVV